MESKVFIYMIYKESLGNNCIGTVQLFLRIKSKQAFIARFMIKNEELRGQGLGKEALEEIVRIGFEEFGLNEIKLNVFDFNERAIRCYESIGFKKNEVKENVHKSSSGQIWNNVEMVLDKELWGANRLEI